jgi:hypothetical protein
MTDGADKSGSPVRRVRRTRTRKRASAASSGLVSGPAAKKVEKAARAVGLSTQELVDLVSDSGLMGERPAGDGVTEVLTLQDLGARLHTLSCAEPRDTRAEWFAGLAPTQKKALLTVLRERGYATAVIAQEYGIDPLEVVQAHNAFADNLGKNVINTRLSTLAGHMQLAAERAQQGLMEKSDWAGFWRIQKDMVGLLQDIGVIERAAQKIEVDSKVSVGFEEKQAEMERILSLERRRDVRRIEITKARESDNETTLDEPQEGSGDAG